MALDLTAFRSALDSLRRAITRSLASPADDIYREAATRGLIADPSAWFGYQAARNETSHTYSDLDLVVQTERPMRLEDLGALRSAFSECDLPIKVDVVDWTDLATSFRRAIETELVPLYP